MPSTSDVFLPVTFNRMSGWPGHQPGTRTRLRAILDKAALRAGGLSLAERALFAVCEFWSSVVTQSLGCHLGANPEQRLRSAAMIYTAMGAKRTARVMEKTLGELARTQDDLQRERRIAALAAEMLRSHESVVELIALFARRVLPQVLEAERRPTATVAVAAAGIVAGAPRRVVASVRQPPPMPSPRARERPYVGWRTESSSVGQHD